VLALMVVAVWLLGVGTLKDLALVQLVGILVGTYSSIFFATPLLVTLRERTELVRSHNRRVVRRRKPDAAEQAGTSGEDASDTTQETEKAATAPAGPAPSKPAPGARPVRPAGTRRPSGKRNAGRR
jgi:preprotein translocase subunit SecF